VCARVLCVRASVVFAVGVSTWKGYVMYSGERQTVWGERENERETVHRERERVMERDGLCWLLSIVLPDLLSLYPDN